MKVFKYRLTPEKPCRILMPIVSQAIAVGAQGDELYVWALVDRDMHGEREHRFFVYGTGHDIQREGLHFIGTAFMHGGFVWHVFEDYRTFRHVT
jgi:hypothetical protein